MFPKLRRQSASEITSFDLPGYAIGGLSVGEPAELMNEMLEATTPADAEGQTTLSDGGWFTGLSSGRDRFAALTCSTASCRPESEETGP
jgi:hypothetical protein